MQFFRDRATLTRWFIGGIHERLIPDGSSGRSR